MEGLHRLGYPDYMTTILGTFKILGAIALLVPKFPMLKEWAYAGATFLLIGAAWSHAACHESPMSPLIVLVIIIASYVLRLRVPEAAGGKTMAALA